MRHPLCMYSIDMCSRWTPLLSHHLSDQTENYIPETYRYQLYTIRISIIFPNLLRFVSFSGKCPLHELILVLCDQQRYARQTRNRRADKGVVVFSSLRVDLKAQKTPSTSSLVLVDSWRFSDSHLITQPQQGSWYILHRTIQLVGYSVHH